jgi:hypothetical protein
VLRSACAQVPDRIVRHGEQSHTPCGRAGRRCIDFSDNVVGRVDLHGFSAQLSPLTFVL